MPTAVVRAGDDLAAVFMDYPNPDKCRARGLMQTGITVGSPRIPATEIVQPMAKHHDKRQPILDGFPPIGFVSRIRRPIGSGAVGAA